MNIPLFEQYRPTTWSDVVGQDKAVRRIRALGERAGYSGRAWWIVGQTGTGKTTLARLLAGEVADPMNVEEIDASNCTPAYLQRVESTGSMFGLGAKHGRAFVVNEAHGLTRAAVRQLLVILERIPPHVVWVFTTTNDGHETLEGLDDGGPLLSRTISVELSRRDLATAFASRAMMIAQAEGLDGGQPLERVIALAKLKRNNMRAMLQEIEAGALMDLETAALAA